tara:strand:- start:4407 stop:4766 length:360 start_codon:yes stop_codon:yes gene_type:complete
MNKMFCVSCGFKVHYEISKPKFCSSCGYDFTGVSKSKTKEGGEEESSIEEINVDKLKKDISVEYNSSKTTLKDLLGTSSAASDNPEYSPRPASSSAEGEEIIKQIREECATSRSRDVDE